MSFLVRRRKPKLASRHFQTTREEESGIMNIYLLPNIEGQIGNKNSHNTLFSEEGLKLGKTTEEPMRNKLDIASFIKKIFEDKGSNGFECLFH